MEINWMPPNEQQWSCVCPSSNCSKYHLFLQCSLNIRKIHSIFAFSMQARCTKIFLSTFQRLEFATSVIVNDNISYDRISRSFKCVMASQLAVGLKAQMNRWTVIYGRASEPIEYLECVFRSRVERLFHYIYGPSCNIPMDAIIDFGLHDTCRVSPSLNKMGL